MTNHQKTYQGYGTEVWLDMDYQKDPKPPLWLGWCVVLFALSVLAYAVSATWVFLSAFF